MSVRIYGEQLPVAYLFADIKTTSFKDIGEQDL